MDDELLRQAEMRLGAHYYTHQSEPHGETRYTFRDKVLFGIEEVEEAVRELPILYDKYEILRQHGLLP